MKISCVAVDDVKLNREAIHDLIAEVDFLNEVGIFENASDALQALDELEPDVMFLDIEMPGISGLEFFKSLTNPPITIITTSHPEFAVEGFEMNVFDYLVKPITRERFLKCVSRLRSHFKSIKKPFLAQQVFVKVGTKYLKVKLSEIEYVEAMRDYVMIYTEKSKYMALHKLKSFYAQLPEDQFLRIHRSFVVPIAKIDAIENNEVVIKNVTIPISEKYRGFVYKMLLGRED